MPHILNWQQSAVVCGTDDSVAETPWCTGNGRRVNRQRRTDQTTDQRSEDSAGLEPEPDPGKGATRMSQWSRRSISPYKEALKVGQSFCSYVWPRLLDPLNADGARIRIRLHFVTERVFINRYRKITRLQFLPNPVYLFPHLPVVEVEIVSARRADPTFGKVRADGPFLFKTVSSKIAGPDIIGKGNKALVICRIIGATFFMLLADRSRDRIGLRFREYRRRRFGFRFGGGVRFLSATDGIVASQAC